MENIGIQQKFDQNGYAVCNGVLTGAEISEIRHRLDNYFGDDDETVEMKASDFLADEVLWDVVLKEAVVNSVRSIMGDNYTLFPNMTIRKSLYVDWHVDTAFAGRGNSYVWNRDFCHVQGAIYFQDNTADFGGGLDVVKSSHRPAVPVLRGDHFINEALNPIVNSHVRNRSRLEAKAGDLVLWHARTKHRSTPAKVKVGAPRKYGLFFSAGSGDPYYAHRYLTHLVGQAWQRSDGVTKYVPRYRDILDVRYPDTFPEEFSRRAKAVDIKIATF